MKQDMTNRELLLEYTVVIPTLRAEGKIGELVRALKRQTLPPKEIMVVDSQSEDGTVREAEESGATVFTVDRSAFDHGGTRDWAFRQVSTPFAVCMTQDALPAGEDSLECLLRPFLTHPDLAIAGGRQQAWETASPKEKLVRAYNYPEQSRVWGKEQIPVLGARAFYLSDVFAAYRMSAYLAVGGFDRPVPTNEDMLITQRFLEAGYLAAYAGDACVFHSHDFPLLVQARRNYLIGKTVERYRDRLGQLGEIGEGKKLAMYVLSHLIRAGHFASAAAFTADSAARLLGNRMGRRAEARSKASNGKRAGHTGTENEKHNH